MMDIDLYGVFLCCRAFAGHARGRLGRIVNVASIAGKEIPASHYSGQGRSHRVDQ